MLFKPVFNSARPYNFQTSIVFILIRVARAGLKTFWRSEDNISKIATVDNGCQCADTHLWHNTNLCLVAKTQIWAERDRRGGRG